jgi:hypothetical protein
VVLAIHAALHFDASDGSFSDVFEGTVEKDASRVSLSAQLAADKHRGTYDLTSPARNYQNPVLKVSTTLDSWVSGSLILDEDRMVREPSGDIATIVLANWPLGDAAVDTGGDGG